MDSVCSDSSPNFLDHVHCSVCYRSFVTSSNEAFAFDEAQNGASIAFWMAECEHVLCQRELDVGIDPTSNEIQAICPTCAQPVRMLRLVDGHVPHAVRRFLQPFEVSTNELMSAYQFQFKHMSDLITFLKEKTAKHKKVLESVSAELAYLRRNERELDEVRTENRTLKERLAALQRHMSSNSGTHDVNQQMNSQRSNGYISDRTGTFMQPLQQFALRQEDMNRRQHQPAHVSSTQAYPNEGLTDRGIQMPNVPSRPSTSSSCPFAFQLPPQPFREKVPKMHEWTSANPERYKHQPAVPLVRPTPTRVDPVSARNMAGPARTHHQQHLSQGSPMYKRSVAADRSMQPNAPRSRSVQPLIKTETQRPHYAPPNSWLTPAGSSRQENGPAARPSEQSGTLHVHKDDVKAMKKESMLGD
ncbi:uncharacterized protein UHOD_04115 [Ustilago sp. UG-2017b]|nr:uncharacterized protein UHOD_04115 [Ustilago sp. UG-2017b]